MCSCVIILAGEGGAYRGRRLPTQTTAGQHEEASATAMRSSLRLAVLTSALCPLSQVTNGFGKRLKADHEPRFYVS